MINKVEHLGIAVKDIDSSNKLFAKLLDASFGEIVATIGTAPDC